MSGYFPAAHELTNLKFQGASIPASSVLDLVQMQILRHRSPFCATTLLDLTSPCMKREALCKGTVGCPAHPAQMVGGVQFPSCFLVGFFV